ncbi:MAG: amidohydrolase family protein [Balneolaceae bacterium]|nr:amidohydrolase family protein [Balneolaceae bacterium]MBO6546512.1 amidohydrolase family protein [Balneolaceae bacterium]MBO6648871.1 amidohydrolase family protein [Balneolaceae bacterium]
MKRKFRVLAALVILVSSGQLLSAQETPAQAISNITIHNTDGSVTESATIVWRDGIIEAIGTNVTVPFDAYVTDANNEMHLYPGFIDGFTTWGSPSQPRDPEDPSSPGEAPYNLAGVQPERIPSQHLEADKNFEAAMKAGFTTAALGLEGYMVSGQVEVFTLSPDQVKEGLFTNSIGIHGSYQRARGRVYPSTQMGIMAKFRQVMYDAEALQTHIQYQSGNPEMPAPERNEVLEAMFPLLNKSQPLFFTVDDKEDIERLFLYQDEFGFDIVIVSGKEAYAKADELKERNIPVLASIDISEAPEWYAAKNDTSKKEDMEEVTEEEQLFRDRQLEAWMAEAKNIKMLLDAGVMVGYSSHGMELKDASKAIKALLDEGGLTEEDLVKLMTTNTARILGIQQSFGSLETGKNASFTVFDKPFTEEKAKAVYSVSNGTTYEF